MQLKEFMKDPNIMGYGFILFLLGLMSYGIFNCLRKEPWTLLLVPVIYVGVAVSLFILGCLFKWIFKL